MKAGEKVSSSFVMAQMFLGAKIRQISYISKFLLAINASSTKYSYISNQKGVVIEVDNLVILYSAAHSLSELSTLSRGCTTFHHLPVVCHSFGVLVTLSHQNRGYASLTTCLWSATPSEFGLLSHIKCQPFGLAFFSRASYKEYDSPCSSD